MRDIFTAHTAAELAVVTRDRLVESRHYGAAVVTDPTGETVIALGDVDTPIYPRSSLKPFQALASMRTGVALNQQQIALACASHTGSLQHQQVALDMLSAAGLSDHDLQCPTAWPRDSQTRRSWVKEDRDKSRLAFNCSGKHAAFLAAAAHANYPLETYLGQDHPLQRSVIEVLTQYAGIAPEHVSTDGCGAPAPTLPLRNLALAVGKLSSATPETDPLAAQITAAMLAHPELVEGPGAPNSVVIEDLGVIAKLGAEGVLVLGSTDGFAVAVKILDGSQRATTLVGLNLLCRAGVLSETQVSNVLRKVLDPIMGGSDVVGHIQLGADFGS